MLPSIFHWMDSGFHSISYSCQFWRVSESTSMSSPLLSVRLCHYKYLHLEDIAITYSW